MKRLTGLLAVFLLMLPLHLWAAEPTPTVTHTVVNVTTNSTAVVSAGQTRRNLMILINDSDTTMYCKVNAAAVINQGIRLNGNGGTVFFDVSVPTGTVNCIHGGTGNKAILVTLG